MGLAEVLIYMVTGIPILVLGLASDFYYFWANNFRSNLKQIIIVRKESHLTIESIKMLTMFCNNYNNENIKSLNAVKTVITFRQRFLVKENIQYLLFGQFMNGNNQNDKSGGTHLKNMKTETLKNYKNKNQELKEVADQVENSRYKLQQFKELKCILMNLSYNDNGIKTLNVDII